MVYGPNMFGTLDSVYKCYEDPFYTTGKAILIHKSDNWMYTGYAYLPYIPLWRTPVIHTTKMQPGVGMMSRYATYAKNGNFFATVTCA